MGRGKAWRVGVCLAAGLSWPVWGAEARARLEVSARVVHGAQVEAPLRVPGGSASRHVPGGTEWRIQITNRLARIDLTRACEGATMRLTGSGATRELRIFVPTGSGCTPVVVATVLPDQTTRLRSRR